MGESGELLRDGHGRVIEYARVSITDACDYRCVFCMPAAPVGKSAALPPLATGETLRLCRILARLGVGALKITGGEPFMNPDAATIMAALKQSAGVRVVTVTTNGSTLDSHIAELAAAGVDGVNVSLGGFCPETYARVTRSAVPVGRVLDSILLARKAGLRVKINMVPIHGVNDGDIVQAVAFALEHDITLRFIELMPLGEGRGFRGMTRDEATALIEARFGPMTPVSERFGNGPAVYSRIEGHAARIGYIAAVSGCFCAGCNRVRLTGNGFLKTCLHSDHGVDIAGPLRRGESDDALAARIRAAVAGKPERHHFGELPAAAGGEPMYRIGG